jgi:hypothetical protein
MEAATQPLDSHSYTVFIAQVSGASDDAARREIFRREFQRIRREISLYPEVTSQPSICFESAARTVREVAASCLPFGLAIVMHLYPLCALQCAPLPALSIAGFKRRMLMKIVRDRSLVIANAGSERSRGAHSPITVTLGSDGLRVSGTWDYVSLASVADVVLFSAPLAGSHRSVFCAADMRGASVRAGESKFSGSMQLSDTRSLTFAEHRIEPGRYLLLSDAPGAQCIFDYQRCWFHLLLAEAYLARIVMLRLGYSLPERVEQRMAGNELTCLREYALRLLDDCRPNQPVDALSRVTATLKLRVSTMAQETAEHLRNLATHGPGDAGLESHAGELGYMRYQPTPDDRILRSLAG